MRIPKIPNKSLRALKALHLVGSIIWSGGVLCTLITLVLLSRQLSATAALALIDLVKLIDYSLIIPGATLCFIIGGAFAIFSKWGFFKNRWVFLKWVLFIIACVPAMILFLPTVGSIQDSFVLGGVPFAQSALQQELLVLIVMTAAQSVIAVIMVTLSVYKPTKRKV